MEWKDEVLTYFGIVCKGYHRVINEFENGNVFMIERNDPIDFVGEVTILAEKEKTSVTIETLTECTVLYFSRKDFEWWTRRISISSGLYPIRWRISCTVLLITGAGGCFIRRSIF